MTFGSQGGRTAGGQDRRSGPHAGYNALLVGLIAFVVVATGVSTGQQVRFLVAKHPSVPAIRVDGPNWALPPLSGQGIPLVVAPGLATVVRPAPLVESQPPRGLESTGSPVAHAARLSPTIQVVDGSLWLEMLAQQFAARTSAGEFQWSPKAGAAGGALTPQLDASQLRRTYLVDR